MFQNVLVTGGAGFIGSHLVDKLLNLGKKVVVLDALTYAADIKNLNLTKVKLYEGNINDVPLVENILKKYSIDTIINCAAESHVDNSISHPDVFIETNVKGTSNLLKCALTHSHFVGPNFRFLQMSTDEVYGSLGPTGYFVENSPISPRSPYSASKASADHLVSAWFHTYNLPTIITRCSNNYGTRQNKEKLIPKTILNALSKKEIPVYGSGKNIRDWIHVKDHCDGVILALEKGMPGEVYCLGGNNEIPNIDIVNGILEYLRELKKEDFRNLITFVKDRLGHDFRYAIDFSHAKKTLGFQPQISFETGLREVIDWYAESYKLPEEY